MKSWILSLLVAVMLCLSLAPSLANEASFAEISTKANQGDASAQYHLGRMYQAGREVPQDWSEAVKWYRKAAEQGYGPAETSLGGMYSGGYAGLQQDDTEADKWYRKAAEQGDSNAKFVLALKKYSTVAFVRSLPQAYRDTIFYSVVALIIAAILTVYVLAVTICLRFFTKIIAKFTPPFGMASKAAVISIVAFSVIFFSHAFSTNNFLLIGVLIVGGSAILGQIIKHPKTGSIGSRKGGFIFGVSIVAPALLTELLTLVL